MPATDLNLLVEAARMAGEIALAHWRQAPETWRKEDGSPVSQADLAVDAALREILLDARPDYGWLSEETPDTPDRRIADACFIVDPIDGTRAYLEGQTDWALSLGVSVAGRMSAGVVHMPAKDLTYTAQHGAGAHLNGDPLAASRTEEIRDATLLASRPTYAGSNWKDRVPQVSRKFRPSMAYRLALVGQGRFDAMMTLKPAWEWDIAAGSLIASEAGARVTDRRGAVLEFNSPERRTNGILAAPVLLHAAILGALA